MQTEARGEGAKEACSYFAVLHSMSLTLMDATPVSLPITYPFTSIYFMTYLANINPLHHY